MPRCVVASFILAAICLPQPLGACCKPSDKIMPRASAVSSVAFHGTEPMSRKLVTTVLNFCWHWCLYRESLGLACYHLGTAPTADSV